MFLDVLMLRLLLLALLATLASAASAVSLGSKHAILIDEASGRVLFQKNASDIVPIASLTKLMTAMVVLDAHLDMEEPITITEDDVDTLKFSSSRVPVGATFSRRTLLELALMSSDNRAAHALARTYPGGLEGWRVAARNKAMALQLRRTNIGEPTGLSPNNTSTAADLAKLAMAASNYPEIEQITTVSEDLIEVGGRPRQYHNTNRLVRDRNWDILLSKTGFTKEAGRCIVMRVRAAGHNAVMVLLNARESINRTADANRLYRMLAGENEAQVVAGLR
jgi:D-alanyl-D-alanine carboxypeptidase/D-alanyl-D-alanine endopeptidase (penicillin-binding protein 7)